jgi:hypothetical protein
MTGKGGFSPVHERGLTSPVITWGGQQRFGEEFILLDRLASPNGAPHDPRSTMKLLIPRPTSHPMENLDGEKGLGLSLGAGSHHSNGVLSFSRFAWLGCIAGRDLEIRFYTLVMSNPHNLASLFWLDFWFGRWQEQQPRLHVWWSSVGEMGDDRGNGKYQANIGRLFAANSPDCIGSQETGWEQRISVSARRVCGVERRWPMN